MQANVFLDLKPPQQFMLHEFFPASVGPHAHTIIKPNAPAWLALAAAAGREAQEQEAAAQKGLIAGDRDELASIGATGRALVGGDRMLSPRSRANSGKWISGAVGAKIQVCPAELLKIGTVVLSAPSGGRRRIPGHVHPLAHASSVFSRGALALMDSARVAHYETPPSLHILPCAPRLAS